MASGIFRLNGTERARLSRPITFSPLWSYPNEPGKKAKSGYAGCANCQRGNLLFSLITSLYKLEDNNVIYGSSSYTMIFKRRFVTHVNILLLPFINVFTLEFSTFISELATLRTICCLLSDSNIVSCVAGMTAQRAHLWVVLLVASTAVAAPTEHKPTEVQDSDASPSAAPLITDSANKVMLFFFF
jgi:hypothetical protein